MDLISYIFNKIHCYIDIVRNGDEPAADATRPYKITKLLKSIIFYFNLFNKQIYILLQTL